MFFGNFECYMKRQILITLCINIALTIVGYSVFWTAPVIPKLQNIDETPLDRVLSETEASWLASCAYLGCIGANLSAYLSNYIGRRPCLILGGILNIISNIVLTFPVSIAMLFVGKTLVGISINFLFVPSLIYLGEIASPDIRGMMISTTGFFQAFGCFVLYCVGPYVSYQEVGYIIMGVSALSSTVIYFLPESPLYYMMKGNEEAAKESLRILGRTKDVDAELKNMMNQARETENNVYVWKELFTEKRNLRALFITVPLFMTQQSGGTIAIGFFATNIFKNAGSSLPPHIATIIIGATSLISSIFSPMFIDKYGRKILLIVSTAGCFAAMAILGVYFYLDKIGSPSVASLGWLPLLAMITALFFFSVGISIIPSTLAGEMYTPKVRGIGTSTSLCAGFASGFVTTTIFGYIVETTGIYATFWLFAAINFVALIFVIIFVPETKGKTLHEIGNMMID